jgi:hypothetical protein
MLFLSCRRFTVPFTNIFSPSPRVRHLFASHFPRCRRCRDTPADTPPPLIISFATGRRAKISRRLTPLFFATLHCFSIFSSRHLRRVSIDATIRFLT